MSSKNGHYFLFDDLLLYVYLIKTKYKLRRVISLDAAIVDDKIIQNPNFLEIIYEGGKIMFSLASPEEKLSLATSIKNCISTLNALPKKVESRSKFKDLKQKGMSKGKSLLKKGKCRFKRISQQKRSYPNPLISFFFFFK